MNENDVMCVISMCKEYLQQSHDVVELNLPKINRETKEIVQALNRIDPDQHSENTMDENASRSRDEVANMLLNVNANDKNSQSARKNDYAPPANGIEYTVEEFYSLCVECGQMNAQWLFIQNCIENNYTPVKKTKACEIMGHDLSRT